MNYKSILFYIYRRVKYAAKDQKAKGQTFRRHSPLVQFPPFPEIRLKKNFLVLRKS